MLNPRELSVLYRVVVMVIILSAAAPPFLQLAAQTKPGCTRSCGNLNISYPFGTADGGSDCYYPGESNSFLIFCNRSSNPPVAYWGTNKSNTVVDRISLEDHEIRIKVFVAKDCYSEPPNSPRLTIKDFPISSAKNRFTVVGCDTYAYFTGRRNDRFSTGCMSICNNTADVTDGTCNGVGCCQISFPADMKGYSITIGSYNNYSYVHEFNPCGYAFVAANDYFNFSAASLQNITEEQMPLVLDWEIGSQKCNDGYMCKGNATCTDSDTWDGYRCICKKGYKGNPYLSGPEGCQAFLQAIEKIEGWRFSDADHHRPSELVGNVTTLSHSSSPLDFSFLAEPKLVSLAPLHVRFLVSRSVSVASLHHSFCYLSSSLVLFSLSIARCCQSQISLSPLISLLLRRDIYLHSILKVI